jgi:hypothetical protein
LATFLPGAALTIASVELAAGQMVSGASRLINGLVELALRCFGIPAASACSICRLRFSPTIPSTAADGGRRASV